MTDLIADIAEAADDLTEPRQHREPLYEWTAQRNRRMCGEHRVRLPSLLDQLAEMFAPGSPAESGGGGKRGKREGSPAPGNLEAVSAHVYIATGAAKWAWDLRLQGRDTTASVIRGLVGAAGNLDSDRQYRLLADLWSWRHQAQVLTGWKTPLYRPRVACPKCGRVGSIRVNLTRQVADCSVTDCAIAWTPDTIGILAEYIKTVTEGVAA